MHLSVENPTKVAIVAVAALRTAGQLVGPDVAEELDQLRAENTRLRGLVEEAVEDLTSWGAYAPDYFKQKWNLARDIAKYQDALNAVSHD